MPNPTKPHLRLVKPRQRKADLPSDEDKRLRVLHEIAKVSVEDLGLMGAIDLAREILALTSSRVAGTLMAQGKVDASVALAKEFRGLRDGFFATLHGALQDTREAAEPDHARLRRAPEGPGDGEDGGTAS